MPDLPLWDVTACVIGAGPAGLAAGKALVDRGIDFDWFEKGSMVGGLWRIDNDNGGAAAYQTLHLNSSRERTQFPSFPMPATWADYPSHTHLAEYFQSFAEQHDLLGRITFNAEVTAVAPLPGPGVPGSHGWAVTAAGRTRTCRDVLIANGHHGHPKLPDFPGTFTVESFHSHAYDSPRVFDGRRVLVIGVGNSGMDLACDATKSADRVLVATRHGVHVIPKYAFGKPVDMLGSKINGYLPFPVERALYEAVLRLSVGRPEDRGLPKPDHRLLSAHPTVSAEFYERIGHGDITMKPTVERFDGRTVHFVDGTSEEIDLIVFATGYDVRLPFLAPEVFDPAGNAMPLYQRVLTPDRPGLYFIGFMQTVGSNIPLLEYQSQWVGDLMLGRCVLPAERQIRHRIAVDQAAMARRYVRSERHTMQVDYWRYIRNMKEERARVADPSLKDKVARRLAGLR